MVCPVPGCPNLRPCPTHAGGYGRTHRHASRHILTATHCAVCGHSFTPDNPLTRGHIKALSLGGTNEPSNYRAECARCNKGNREI